MKKNSIFITGETGFIGKNIIKNNNFKFLFSNKNFVPPENINFIIHLAGKAHDIKNISNPKEYFEVNTELTKKVFNEFLVSEAEGFITMSSVKAVTDSSNQIIKEDFKPNPITLYGKSKLLAEEYILSKSIPKGKRVYILRPTMVHGPGNKGNLNLLYNLVNKGLPWPLGSYESKRSLCSIDNLTFVINELIENRSIPSGVYNICDDEPISTNEIIKLINKKSIILNIPKHLINQLAKVGDFFNLPLNTERLGKLTETFVVSNEKIKKAIGKPFPVSTKEGLLKTFQSFSQK